jgi:hypothetical protein
MKLILLIALTITSFPSLAQFRSGLNTPGYVTLTGTGASARCRVGSFTINDQTVTAIPVHNEQPYQVANWHKVGLQFCKEIGSISTSGTAVTNSGLTGARVHASDNSIANCALRTTGAAAGSVTCQSGYTGQ